LKVTGDLDGNTQGSIESSFVEIHCRLFKKYIYLITGQTAMLMVPGKKPRNIYVVTV